MTSANQFEMDSSTKSVSWFGSRRNAWRRSLVGRLLRIKLAVFAILFISVIVICGVFAPVVAPYEPRAFVAEPALAPFSWPHLLGTDALGRDQLSRLIWGARASLQVATFAVAMSTSIGIILGIFAAYFKGLVDSILMRIIDAMLALPGLVLPLTLLSVLGGGISTVSLALGIAFIPTITRLLRAQALSQMERDYVLAAQSIGVSPLRIMFVHITPNSLAPVVVQASLAMSVAVIAEAGLSFLGVGVTPPTPTWGVMLTMGFDYVRSEPTMALAPAAAVFLLVLSFNFLGDGLRDVLDPRLRGSI